MDLKKLNKDKFILKNDNELMKYEKLKLRKLNYRAETVENVKITRSVLRKFKNWLPPLLQNTPDTVNKLTDRLEWKYSWTRGFRFSTVHLNSSEQ